MVAPFVPVQASAYPGQPQTPTVVSNPALSQACGLDIALVIDNSTSIDSSEMTQMKSACLRLIAIFEQYCSDPNNHYK